MSARSDFDVFTFCVVHAVVMWPLLALMTLVVFLAPPGPVDTATNDAAPVEDTGAEERGCK
jgi:hypothetical protein